MNRVSNIRPLLAAKPQRHAAASSEAGAGDKVELGSFTPLPSQAIAVTTASKGWTAENRRDVAEQLISQLKAYPSMHATVAVAPSAGGGTKLMVAGREEALGSSSPEGAFGFIADLAGSRAVKGAEVGAFYQPPTPVDDLAHVFELSVPTELDPQKLDAALVEGETPNNKALLTDLLAKLPKGKRVAILLGGPSGAGKTTIINELKQMAGDRKIVALTGDMYFRDMDDAEYPMTAHGTYNWDSPDAMHIDELGRDISKLIGEGTADIPIYDFTATRPGGWRRPVDNVTGIRLDKKEHLELANDDILVIDSLHATNGRIINQLKDLELPHASVYLDTPRAEDRLLRRIVRDYATREGSAERTLQYWDLTTFPGEVTYIRPTLANLDPAQDVRYLNHFEKDLDLSREEIDARVKLLGKYGLPPTYESFAVPENTMPAFARAEEKRLQSIVDSTTASEGDKAKAQRALDRLHAAQQPVG
ncbi:MAG: hypothetical protein FJX76_02940 [Armatimonadetes bacterium]|nr:hypothetical protein [Armatimonadota bacterium]